MKFINASGAMVDLEVQVIHGARKWPADDAYRLLNAHEQPISTQIVAQLLREAKEHAEEQVKYAWSVHRSGSHSSTDAAYSFTRTAGVMADETYNALYHLYSQLSPSAANVQACNDDKRHESLELERSLLGTKYPLFQQTPIAYNNRAFLAMQAKKYEQAIQLYQKAGELLNQQGGINSDEHLRYFRGIVDCYKALNDIPNAIDYLEKAITLHKRLFPAVSRKTWEDEIRTLVTESKQRVGREGVATIDTYPGLDGDDVADVLAALSTSTTQPIVNRQYNSEYPSILRATGGTLTSLAICMTLNLGRVAHAGIAPMVLKKEAEALTLAVGFDPSIHLRVTSELAPEAITRDKFYALIALGANPNSQDYFGKTCLHLILGRFKPESLSTVQKEHRISLLNWLIDVGANLDIADKTGITPRTLAAQKRGLSFVNGVFGSDITPLHRYGFHGIPATEPSGFQGPPSPAPLD
jgi:tetratricopeptide (TPR) repeat protein